MSKRTLVTLKVIVHVLCLLPAAWLLHLYTSGALGLSADPVNDITHYTGNWTMYLLLASLAITPVRRLSPRISWLIRFRRLVGLYAFFYATLHLATYIFLFSGYNAAAAWTDLRGGHPGGLLTQWKLVWPGIADDLRKRRFIQVGLVAWVILLALACTSPSVVMRAMGGKGWQRLHRLVYVAAAAGVVHFWWLVKAGVRSPWKDTAVLMILLAARVAYAGVKAVRRRSSSLVHP